ncbi:chemotaxis protein CheD [Desulfomicrobium macestii]|uniref:Probable chemoreceptor glutamine deamidase CheD n=2 Tax=Desulfomicrobium TaxID=898 RepID=A0A8G2F5Z7_DESNO|nr:MULTISPECIES: chemotaxis protein CheD [Desulfomicrobium]MBE1425243.1 chemotaxis protein CheD [Desulfomicrobium macestii]SFL71394.1 chemotaxis protein CheD [Desulfomicrobium norvegicum]
MQRIAKNRMIIPAQAIDGLEDCRELPHDYLLVGQGGIYSTPTLVQTVLGSCVSVTMYCAKYRWGGIFHALLPRIGDFSGGRTSGDQYRYVDSSIWSLLREFAKAGISAKSIECKVFGGASPLHQNCDASAGNRNVKVAMEVLAEEGVTVSASSVGGNGGRKLFFRTDTGLVLQKRFIVTTCKECKS